MIHYIFSTEEWERFGGRFDYQPETKETIQDSVHVLCDYDLRLESIAGTAVDHISWQDYKKNNSRWFMKESIDE